MLPDSKKEKSCLIYYVVDEIGWVQHKRLKYLTKYQNSYRLKPLSARKFRLLWKLGFLRKKYIFFSSWRTVHALTKTHPAIFKECNYQYFMAAVTSHSNIGGGLDPLSPIPGRSPEEAFALSVALLKKFRVVSANSMILHELLSESLPDLVYCPNGVDTDFYKPADNKSYDTNSIRIGWVGKARSAKNYDVMEKACKELEDTGGFKIKLIKISKDNKKAPLSMDQMLDFYRNIDFYLCASSNEGTPNPALEAAACGVPIVSTHVGNMSELINDGTNGYFIKPTAESIVDCFKEIRHMSKETYHHMSIDIRNSITSNWSWEKRISNFLLTFDLFIKA